ncbi:MAG: exo-alpha-sialidase [Clostridiales bacterium]|nr:exo-alpha-sialidase [Clostridiales bacterium]
MLKVIKSIREEIFGDEREFDSPHAPTVLELKDGNALAAWFGGRFEKDPDTAIWTARRINGAWEKPRKTVDVVNIAAWNPVLFRLNDDRIVLYYKIGAEIQKWHTEYVISNDEAETWSDAHELITGDIGGRGPVKNKPIYLSDNKTILAPASLEGDCWNSFADISEDNGKSWEMSEFVPLRRVNPNERRIRDRVYNKHFCFGRGIIQPTFWEDKDGVVNALFRSTSSRIFRSESHDKGRTWSLAYDTGLPNNNSGIDVAMLKDGTLILAYNPRENIPGMTKGSRTPIILSYSEDNGVTWNELCVLENDDGAFAYPSIICTNNNEIMVVYSANREKIIFWSIKVEH